MKTIHQTAIEHLKKELKEAEKIESRVLRHERKAYLNRLIAKEQHLQSSN